MSAEHERIAIVTMTIGPEHSRRWEQFCERRFRDYAERCGYEPIRITEPLDRSELAGGRSPAWQKCLILGHPAIADAGYDRVIWVDADVVISSLAPPIAAGVPEELVGAVDERSLPDRETHAATLAKVAAYGRSEPAPEHIAAPVTAGRAYYRDWGLPSEFEQVVQTGVMVLTPRHHRDILEDVYRRYEDAGPRLDYEMRPLSWELLKAEVVHWLDPRFNRVWGVHKARHEPFLLIADDRPEAPAAARRALGQVWMLHFAGAGPELDRYGPELADPAADERAEPDQREASRTAAGRAIPQVESPVAMAIYKRVDTTARVLERIRAVRPRRLLVFADMAAEGDDEAAERCAATRALFERIDWDCELETDFAERHMGSRERLESGLDWVFSRVPEAIIVEDDCLTEPSFFAYCDELLERYRDDQRVMSIAGDRFGPPSPPGSPSYTFSRYAMIWGWASWSRAWSLNDPSMSAWPELRDAGWLADLLGSPHAVAYWTRHFEATYSGAGSWDFAWLFANWLHGGLCALPEVNLVSNLGFRPDGAHTNFNRAERSIFAELETAPVGFPLRHPGLVERDAAGDEFLEDIAFGGNLRRAFQILREHRAAPAGPAAGV